MLLIVFKLIFLIRQTCLKFKIRLELFNNIFYLKKDNKSQ